MYAARIFAEVDRRISAGGSLSLVSSILGLPSAASVVATDRFPLVTSAGVGYRATATILRTYVLGLTGLTAGQVLRATSATEAAWGALDLADTDAVTGVLPNGNTTATALNTASAIVARDGSGNFAAGTITASLSGNASTATAWATARTLTIGGTGKSVDGTGNVSWSLGEIGAGDVVGPASATNNAIALFDGTTGKLVKNSVVIVNAGAVTGITTLATSSNVTIGGTLGVTGNLSHDSTSALLSQSTTTAFVGIGSGTGSGDTTLSIRGAAGTSRDLAWRTGASSNRWILRANSTAESGADAGSNFEIISRTDAGAFLRSDVSIIRSSGLINLGAGVTISNAGVVTGGTYNGQTISSAASFTGTGTFATGLTVTTGGITVTGNSTITGTLGGVTTLTATSLVGALTGNASTATTLQTARNINGVSFNGSAAIDVPNYETKHADAGNTAVDVAAGGTIGLVSETVAVAVGDTVIVEFDGSLLNPSGGSSLNAPDIVAGLGGFDIVASGTGASVTTADTVRWAVRGRAVFTVASTSSVLALGAGVFSTAASSASAVAFAATTPTNAWNTSASDLTGSQTVTLEYVCPTSSTGAVFYLHGWKISVIPAT